MQGTRGLRDLGSFLPRAGRRRAWALWPLAGLLGGAMLAGCEDEQAFVPSATYTPDKVVDFGPVAANAEKTVRIKVLSSGGAGLKLVANIAGGEAGKWRVSVPEVFTAGLAPSKTSSISVTYRPCPAAWESVTVPGPDGQPRTIDQLREGFDYDTCPGGADSAQLTTVEQNTRTGGSTFTLSGTPVQPPVITVGCQNGAPMCNAATPNVTRCVTMVFGNVNAGQAPCDQVVEVQNKLRLDKPVGELIVDRIEVNVRELQSNERKNGQDVGFQLLDMDGNPLVVDQTHPLVVPAPGATSSCAEAAAGTCASQRFKIRFTGEATGTWRTDAARGDTGVWLYTSDPDNPIIKFNVNGTGSAPDIEVFPSSINFGPVEQGSTKTSTVTVSNAGDAELVISSLGFATDTNGARFRWETDRGTTLPITLATNDRMRVYVRYTPRTSGQDSDVLLIGNNDPKTMGRVEVPVSGGAVPRLRVDPNDTLVFPSPEPPPAPPRKETFRLSNVGYGDLSILRLEVTGPGGDAAHPSADDFTVDECGGMNPCVRTDVLCPPSLAACNPMDSTRTFTVTYQNNDVSTLDLAELHIRTNDPADMEHVLVLSAQDIPCFYPTPVVTVVTPRPCVGMPVQVSGATSQPGGSGSTTLTKYSWSWLFTPAAAPSFSPNDTSAAGASFTPASSGTYILALDVENSCGQRSQAPATETVNVSDTCN